MANVHRAKGTRPIGPEDWFRITPRRATWRDQLTTVRMLSAAFPGVFRRKRLAHA